MTVPSVPEPAAAAPAAVFPAAAGLLARVREERPMVHCLTNPAALTLSANVLLAVGAEPSLSADPETVRDFVAGTSALVVNLGMLDPAREAAILAATEAAPELGRPWLLDPVKVELSPSRRKFARRLLARRPALVRGNAAEIACFAEGGDPRTLACAAGTVVARTGPSDLVTDGARTAEIANGSPLMAAVTAVGCAASALAGAFLAIEPDSWTAAVAALLVMGVAGELAAARARGPGSFAVELLDALYRLDERDLLERGRVR
ncbi:hydroxyethylthiazole kinase [Benzoatithermus flavus]|uniref:Hydroxyethylthiazole kinase n=1 Tax=Benzoatithermus flavus TaxID=3108223 RepID=A0ABU8XNE6_9PROT